MRAPTVARAWSVLTALAALTIPSPAAAQSDAPTELDLPPWAQAERSYAGLGVEVWPSSAAPNGRQLALVLEPFVQAMVAEHWAVTASFPFGVLDVHREPVEVSTNIGSVTFDGLSDETTAVAGSVVVGAHYTANVAQDHLNLWAGLRLAIPTMLMEAGNGVTAGSDAQRAAPLLSGIRAGTHAHRFAVQQLGVRPEMGLEWLIPADWLYLRSTLAPLVLAPLTSIQSVEVQLDHLTELEARTFFGLGGGLGLREAFAFTDDEKVRGGVEPFLAYESPGAGFVARLGVLVGLDGDGATPVNGNLGRPSTQTGAELDDSLSGSARPPRVVAPRLRLGGTW